jgi:hypothetical protein
LYDENFFYGSFFFALLVFGCHKKETADEEEEVAPDQIQTPVTVTSIEYGPLTEYIDLNATASFIQTSVLNRAQTDTSQKSTFGRAASECRSNCFRIKNERGAGIR